MISCVSPLIFVIDMKHLSEKDRARSHRMASCRKGLHDFGKQQNIGGGIGRQVCTKLLSRVNRPHPGRSS